MATTMAERTEERTFFRGTAAQLRSNAGIDRTADVAAVQSAAAFGAAARRLRASNTFDAAGANTATPFDASAPVMHLDLHDQNRDASARADRRRRVGSLAARARTLLDEIEAVKAAAAANASKPIWRPVVRTDVRRTVVMATVLTRTPTTITATATTPTAVLIASVEVTPVAIVTPAATDDADTPLGSFACSSAAMPALSGPKADLLSARANFRHAGLRHHSGIDANRDESAVRATAAFSGAARRLRASYSVVTDAGSAYPRTGTFSN